MRLAARSTALESAPTASPREGSPALGRGATHPLAKEPIDSIGSARKRSRTTRRIANHTRLHSSGVLDLHTDHPSKVHASGDGTDGQRQAGPARSLY